MYKPGVNSSKIINKAGPSKATVNGTSDLSSEPDEKSMYSTKYILEWLLSDCDDDVEFSQEEIDELWWPAKDMQGFLSAKPDPPRKMCPPPKRSRLGKDCLMNWGVYEPLLYRNPVINDVMFSNTIKYTQRDPKKHSRGSKFATYDPDDGIDTDIYKIFEQDERDSQDEDISV